MNELARGGVWGRTGRNMGLEPGTDGEGFGGLQLDDAGKVVGWYSVVLLLERH
jgi:hypothetical protein